MRKALYPTSLFVVYKLNLRAWLTWKPSEHLKIMHALRLSLVEEPFTLRVQAAGSIGIDWPSSGVGSVAAEKEHSLTLGCVSRTILKVVLAEFHGSRNHLLRQIRPVKNTLQWLVCNRLDGASLEVV